VIGAIVLIVTIDAYTVLSDICGACSFWSPRLTFSVVKAGRLVCMERRGDNRTSQPGAHEHKSIDSSWASRAHMSESTQTGAATSA
jgi:hypothetical protein